MAFQLLPVNSGVGFPVFVAAERSGGVQSMTLTFPNDFPGYPDNISPIQAVEIKSVHVQLTTDANVGNRFIRVRVRTDQAFTQAQWTGTQAQAATATKRHQFAQGATPASPGTAQVEESLPSGLYLLQPGWTLVIDIINAKAGDTLDEAMVTGEFR